LDHTLDNRLNEENVPVEWTPPAEFILLGDLLGKKKIESAYLSIKNISFFLRKNS